MGIVCLIYRSTRLADWLFDSVAEFTPKIRRGEARFLFVANDPTDECLLHLESRGYPHFVNRNPVLSESELFAMGYGAPEYMHRVYRGYNEGIRQVGTPWVVLVNSDNYFSVDWLENMEKYSAENVVVSARLVEPGHPEHGVFPDAIHADFGRTIEGFDKESFLRFAEATKQTGLVAGGAYMPCLIRRDVALGVGLYPEGNIAGRSYAEIREYGDEAFFGRLRRAGVRHVTALDSIVYHLKEGEADEGMPGVHPRASDMAAATARTRPSSTLLPMAVLKEDGRTYLAESRFGFYHSEIRAFFKRLPKTVSRILEPILPPWAFNSARTIWRGISRIRG